MQRMELGIEAARRAGAIFGKKELREHHGEIIGEKIILTDASMQDMFWYFQKGAFGMDNNVARLYFISNTTFERIPEVRKIDLIRHLAGKDQNGFQCPWSLFERLAHPMVNEAKMEETFTRLVSNANVNDTKTMYERVLREPEMTTMEKVYFSYKYGLLEEKV